MAIGAWRTAPLSAEHLVAPKLDMALVQGHLLSDKIKAALMLRSSLLNFCKCAYLHVSFWLICRWRLLS